MLSALVTKAFWIKIWEWCKINWKFILGISIPIVVSILMRKGNVAKIYRIAAETRQKQLKALEKSTTLEADQKQEAQEEFLRSTKEILDTHKEALAKIEDDEKRFISEIDSAEKATDAIKKKLEE